MRVPSLFLVPYPSDVGFAIDRLLSAFFTAFCALNGGDTSQVHFSFTSMEGGPSKALPQGFGNVITFDPSSRFPNPTFERYVRKNNIRLVVLLDEQPLSPLAKTLRRLGVECVVSYWGAPIAGPSNRVKLFLKRLSIAAAGRRRVDSLIFESHAMADMAITGRGCAASMLDIIPTGVDPNRFKPTADKTYVHEQFGVERGRLIVVFAGHVHERKGIGTLMDAAVILLKDRRRSDLFFLICGNRDDEATPYEQRLRGTGVESRVCFAGCR